MISFYILDKDAEEIVSASDNQALTTFLKQDHFPNHLGQKGRKSLD